jgi:hypothetical protein
MILSDITRLRLCNERLVGPPFATAGDAVRALAAVQAQDYTGAKWAIGQRVRNARDADIESAYVAGKILRTHIMRPTWHFVLPENIRWIQDLTAPRVRAAIAYYDRQLELDGATLGRSNAALARALRGGLHLTRSELARVLRDAGIDADGQRLGHLIMHAELDALICSGALRGRQHTYALLDERVPQSPRLTRHEALAQLTFRYFASHGPALPQDFAWWSGLTVADAKAGLDLCRHGLIPEVVGRKTYWRSASVTPRRPGMPIVHLLPNYDEYLVSYRDHSASLHHSLPPRSAVRYDARARHFIVVDGRVAGGWRRTVDKGGLRIETNLLVPLDAAQEEALHAAADRYGRFAGMRATLVTLTRPRRDAV